MPPAKSSAPFWNNQPEAATAFSAAAASVNASGPGQNQTMCATGRYANVNHNTVNNNTAENLIRSANEPTMRPQVIAAKVAWKAKNTNSGITTPLLKVAAIESGVMPFKNNLSNPPKNFPPSVNAIE